MLTSGEVVSQSQIVSSTNEEVSDEGPLPCLCPTCKMSWERLKAGRGAPVSSNLQIHAPCFRPHWPILSHFLSFVQAMEARVLSPLGPHSLSLSLPFFSFIKGDGLVWKEQPGLRPGHCWASLWFSPPGCNCRCAGFKDAGHLGYSLNGSSQPVPQLLPILWLSLSF